MTGDVLLLTGQPPEALTTLRDALRGEGYTLAVARDLDTALQLARQRLPIAILIEATAQPETGYALCRWLRTDPATVAITILITACDNTQRLAALQAGADEFLSSPLDWLEIRTRLRTLAAGRKRMPSLDDFLSFMPDLALGANPVDVLGSADMLSHDLKSPVGVVASILELLKEYAQDRLNAGSALAEREMRLFEGALLACRRLTFLIDDMIDLAKIEVDAYPVQLTALDPNAVLREVLKINAATIARKGIPVTVEAPDTLPRVVGDYALLVRVCNALLDNALKFTTSQGRAMFSFEVDGDHLVIRLSDDGRPIAPEYDDAIFERGVQWEARQHGSRTSVGLGLPFARAAMRRMNGDLVAYSSPADKITVFSLYLPLADQANNR